MISENEYYRTLGQDFFEAVRFCFFQQFPKAGLGMASLESRRHREDGGKDRLGLAL